MAERAEAIALANRVLDRINADPDDDLAVLARQFLREIERGALDAADYFWSRAQHDSDAASFFAIGERWANTVGAIIVIKGGGTARELFEFMERQKLITPGKAVDDGARSSAQIVGISARDDGCREEIRDHHERTDG